MALSNSSNITIPKLKKFDVVSDDSDHHYLKLKNRDCFVNNNSNLYKKIMQEWRILDKHLPENIYVRVYENRIDLLRAVIVGTPGTPYHDGLFFFDIAFPPQYPTKPPQVHYKAFGLRLNPNLYSNGHVCLSLINTWSGKKFEKWNPSQSTMLQILVSIQSLVLNEQPYYNEPFLLLSNRSEKKSQAYNEDVFLLTCYTMLYLIRKPPKNFEDFIEGYFREKAEVILKACIAYSKGIFRVGCYNTNVGSSSLSFSKSKANVSMQFKNNIGRIYPLLVTAFKINGASLENFVEQLVVEKKTTPSKAGERKRAKGVGQKIAGIIKKVLGFKSEKKQTDGKSDIVSAISSSSDQNEVSLVLAKKKKRKCLLLA